ncbi:hypothetical protein PM082_010413 [Marasmius tenuissimus]|nr:hypothetical protein PM082_010413 [Marasmius tenuissimus]
MCCCSLARGTSWNHRLRLQPFAYPGSAGAGQTIISTPRLWSSIGIDFGSWKEVQKPDILVRSTHLFMKRSRKAPLDPVVVFPEGEYEPDALPVISALRELRPLAEYLALYSSNRHSTSSTISGRSPSEFASTPTSKIFPPPFAAYH